VKFKKVEIGKNMTDHERLDFSDEQIDPAVEPIDRGLEHSRPPEQLGADEIQEPSLWLREVGKKVAERRGETTVDEHGVGYTPVELDIERPDGSIVTLGKLPEIDDNL
jgi:hypothetical protein